MNDLAIVLLIAVTAILPIVFIVVVGKAFIGLKSRVDKKYPGRGYYLVDIGANFFGQSSKGYKQVRGNGALVLGYNELWFTMAIPKREMTIPISSVTNITMPKSFLGKSILKPLLCVEFERNGAADSIAWAVKDPQAWQAKIQEIRPKVTA